MFQKHLSESRSQMTSADRAPCRSSSTLTSGSSTPPSLPHTRPHKYLKLPTHLLPHVHPDVKHHSPAFIHTHLTLTLIESWILSIYRNTVSTRVRPHLHHHPKDTNVWVHRPCTGASMTNMSTPLPYLPMRVLCVHISQVPTSAHCHTSNPTPNKNFIYRSQIQY